LLLYLLGESTKEPDEGLLKLIVALGRDVVVLQVLLSVERDLLSLDLSVLDVDLVTDEADRNALANANQVLVPLRYVLVRDTCAHVKHDYAAVASDVISVT